MGFFKKKETKAYCMDCMYGYEFHFEDRVVCKKIIEVTFEDTPWRREKTVKRLDCFEQNKNNNCPFFKKKTFFNELTRCLGF